MITQKNKLFGVDLLKVVSILMIIALHMLGQGGIVASAAGIDKVIYKSFSVLCLPAVNILCITTGYLMVNKSFRASRVLNVLIQFCFVALIMFCFSLISTKNVLESLKLQYESLHTTYWYFLDYLIVLFLCPLLNIAIDKTNNKYMFLLLLTLFLAFSLITTLLTKDIFATNNGYSVIWMVFLYLVGGAIKKTTISFKKVFAAIAFVLSYLLCIILQYFLRNSQSDYLNSLSVNLLAYNSPLIFAMSVSLFLLLFDIELKNDNFCAMFSFLASSTLLSYLIHCNGYFYIVILNGAFSELTNYNTALVLAIIVIVPILYHFVVSLVNVPLSLVVKKIIHSVFKTKDD